jgi:GNAT superfamily N-acetyltransferase
LKDHVPFTVVAFVDGLPVGSCYIIENDCVHRKQYAPWVAAVFVKPEVRNRGVASAILQEAANIATRSGIEGLYIDCHVMTAPVYEKNGWEIYEREVGDKDSVIMLRRIKRLV